MAFTVEDGTGLTDSNALIDVAFADAYFADRGGDSVWTASSEPQKQAAIVQATDYICGRFRFKGTKYNDEQALEFPRVFCDSEDPQMPVKMKQAVAEYAKRARTAPLLADPTVDATGAMVVSKKEKVGPLEEETTYSETTALRTFTPYPAADMLLRGLTSAFAKRTIR
jgi:hypothetical protein